MLSGALEQPILDADSMLVRNGKIERIGRGSELVGEAPDVVVDAQGSTVAPGLIDSHVHPVFGDWAPRQVQLHWIDSMMNGGVTSMISAGEVHPPGCSRDILGLKALAVTAQRAFDNFRPGGVKIHAGAPVLEQGMMEKDFKELAEAGVKWLGEVGLAGLQHRRRQRLLKQGVIAREAFDTADAGVKTWQARLDAAQRRLDELLAGTRRDQIQAQEALVAQFDTSLVAIEIDLDKSVLKAPFAGKVAKRLVDTGMVVNAGQSLVRLVEATQPEVHVGLPPHVAANVIPGSRQSVRIGQTTRQAQVARILPELDTATRTVLTVLTLSAPGNHPSVKLFAGVLVCPAPAGYRLDVAAPDHGLCRQLAA